MNDENFSAEILVIEDDHANIELLSSMLSSCGYKVRVAPGGEFALRALQRTTPDLILLDVNMPDMDGYEVCRRIRATKTTAEIPVVFVSGLKEPLDRVKAFQAGGNDYITKPFAVEEVESRVEALLGHARDRRQMESSVNRKNREIVRAYSGMIVALTQMVESRDDETAQHLDRVRRICRLLAETLRNAGLHADKIDTGFIKRIYRTSVLHDIGKVGIPDAILLKPGRLTSHEFEHIKDHTTIGVKILKAVGGYFRNTNFFDMGTDIIQYHHEKWDGSGYPDGLAGEDIPLAARIMAVADVYDALRSRRVYKPPQSHTEARAVIEAGAGLHFDPAVVAAFLECEYKLARFYIE